MTTTQANEITGPIWLWNAAEGTLCCRPLDGEPHGVAFPIDLLRMCGWKVDEAGFARSLPRTGGPVLAAANQGDLKRILGQRR